MNTLEAQKNVIAARNKLAGFVAQDEARAQALRELAAAEAEAKALTDRINSPGYKADVKRADKLESEVAEAYQEAVRGMEAVKAALDKAEGKHNEFKTLLKTLDGFTREQQQARIHGRVYSRIHEMMGYVIGWMERNAQHEIFRQMGRKV